MGPTASSSTRKRGRPIQQQAHSSSPLSGATPLTAIKRRKLDKNGSSPSTPKALQALKNAFGGVFSFGKTKESVTGKNAPATNGSLVEATREPASDADELGDEPLATGNQHAKINGSRHRYGSVDAQFAKTYTRREITTQSPTPKRKQRRSRMSKIPIDAEAAEDELGVEAETLNRINHEQSENEAEIPKIHTNRKLKRPGKSSITDVFRAGSIEDTKEGFLEDLSSGGAGRSSGRERRRPRRYSSEMVEIMESQQKGILTPSKTRHAKPIKSSTFGAEDPVPDDLELGLQDIANPDDSVKTAKPMKRKRGRPKKGEAPGLLSAAGASAGLDTSKDDETVIRDKTLKPSKANARELSSEKLKRLTGEKATVVDAPPPKDVAESNDDDAKCVICGGGDSEKPDEIILCDNCDLAAHQECYGVEVIPEGDWLCRDCRPDEEEDLTGIGVEPILDIGNSNVPDIEGFEYHLQIMQKMLLDKLTGQRRLKLYGLDDEFQKVHQVVEQTVLAGEGNSMLVIGARGCGKTTLVESVMSDLSEDHRQDFHIVRLNGFIHTDDKLALREIWRQLGREMEVDDDLTSKTNNYADTLASLLALLSHPSEISEVEADHTAKSVVFILDEFDLFASHPRQTLLYNLFDIAQARKAPIAVLGLTTKIDVVERLEKRVKSRFSHRYVHLPLPRNLPAYWEICKQGLLIDMDELVAEGFTPGLSGQNEFQSFWKFMIDDLYNKDPIFKQYLQTHFYRSKSVTSFLTSCILPIANLTPNTIPLTGVSFTSTLPVLSPPDSKLHLLQSLSELDLALLIAAARLNIILDTENCNFAMAYDEYSSLTSKHKIQTSSTGVAALGAGTKVWGREVAMSSWERLVDCELLVPTLIGGTGTMGRDVGREAKMWKVDVALEEIPGSVDGLSGIMAKWCREI